VARIALLKEIKSGFDLHKNGLHAFRQGKPGQQKKTARRTKSKWDKAQKQRTQKSVGNAETEAKSESESETESATEKLFAR